MSFTVDDFQDLLRLLDEHPEWRAELRRQVLTDELLELPALFRDFATRSEERFSRIEAALERLTEAQERTDARIGELAAAQARTDARMEELAAAQARTESRMEEFTAAQARTETRMEELVAAQSRTETRMEEIAADLRSVTTKVAELVITTNRMDNRLARTERITLELRFAKNGAAYFSRLARRLKLIDTGVLADLLDDAIEAGQLQDEDRQEILRTDLVFSGRRREDQADIYILAEVSSGIGPSDVERASERSTRLAKLGRDVIPVVVGFQITAEGLELAREQGVAQFLNDQPL